MTSKRKTPAADKKWSKEARDLWRTVHQDYALEKRHTVLLFQACCLLTRAADARQHIAEHGMMTTDRFGGEKLSPAVDIERSSISAARLVLRELGLDFDGPASADKVRIHRSAGYA